MQLCGWNLQQVIAFSFLLCQPHALPQRPRHSDFNRIFQNEKEKIPIIPFPGDQRASRSFPQWEAEGQRRMSRSRSLQLKRNSPHPFTLVPEPGGFTVILTRLFIFPRHPASGRQLSINCRQLVDQHLSPVGSGPVQMTYSYTWCGGRAGGGRRKYMNQPLCAWHPPRCWVTLTFCCHI